MVGRQSTALNPMLFAADNRKLMINSKSISPQMNNIKRVNLNAADKKLFL